MSFFTELDVWLKQQAGEDETARAVSATITAMTHAAARASRMIARGLLNPGMENMAISEVFTHFDAEAGNLFMAALKEAPVAAVAREKAGIVDTGKSGAPLALVMDALNGSSNIDANLSVGTLFSIFPEAGGETFSQPGEKQLAAGFFIYGPRTALAFTTGKGTHIATMDPDSLTFYVTAENMKLAADNREYAVNASNYRFWDPAIRTYVDDMIDGAAGPRGVDYNMRWAASLVAEAMRILNRGGIFLYPRDSRPGYSEGRLRLLFQANPVAMLVEQAGGMATDGYDRILEKAAQELGQRTPLVFGAREEVERVRRYHDLPLGGARSPLFSKRGLFRA